jgi:peptidoglycan-associated lipoprotein
MTTRIVPPKTAGVISAALLALGLSACATEPPRARVKADAGGPDRSIAVASDVAAGSGQDFMLNVGRRTFFAQGSAELDSVTKATLSKQAAWLVRYPTWQVKVQGFSDDPGTPAANEQLSTRRADAVRSFLVSQGVSATRIDAKGYGRTRLVRDCADSSCKAQNRRVVTNLQGDEEG